MSGIVLMIIGATMILGGCITFLVGIIYTNTKAKVIKKNLKEEYDF